MSRRRGYRIVLTADRTLMSEYHGGIFLGFSACVPRGLIPDRVYFSVFCPPVKAGPDGSAEAAPYGTRKIEAALLEYGFRRDEVIVAHPEHLDRVIGPETRALGITENDPLGIGPATSTFTGLFGGEAYMAVKFRELLNHPSVRRYRPRIIVGGPGAWQLIGEPQERLGIDCVVLGEGERVVGPLFEKAIRGEPLPSVVHGEPVPVEEIPIIRGATIDGLVEIARGCGRGCRFCEPTLQRYRALPIPHILKEVEVNVRHGRRNPILHAEDVLRYGAKKPWEVDVETVVNLFKAVKSVPGVDGVGLSHFALASVASAPEAVEGISKVEGIGDSDRFLSGQTGIETGSPRLMRRLMAGKCLPFKPEDWPDVVERAFGILEEHGWIPVSTLIVGLPGETEEDVCLTIDLVERLRTYRSLIVPLFLVSMGSLRDKTRSFTYEDLTQRRSELIVKCWRHNLDWAPSLIETWSRQCIKNGIARRGIKLVFSYGIRVAKRLLRECAEKYGYDIKAMREDYQRMGLGTRIIQSLKAVAS